MNISDYIEKDLITFFNAKSRDEVLEKLVDLLDKQGKLPNRKAFLDAIFEREALVSTGLGMSVAVPHAKLEDFEDFFIAIGIQQEGLEWEALDGCPVNLIFMIGGPKDQQTEYLQILSKLTGVIKDENKRSQLLSAKKPEDIVAIFTAIDPL